MWPLKEMTDDKVWIFKGMTFQTLSLSLSFPVRGGAGHRPNPFQVAPEASRISCKAVS